MKDFPLLIGMPKDLYLLGQSCPTQIAQVISHKLFQEVEYVILEIYYKSWNITKIKGQV